MCKEETTNHAFSTSEVASMVWKKDAMVMGIFNNVNKTWRVKLSLWFRGARPSSMIGVITDLLPSFSCGGYGTVDLNHRWKRNMTQWNRLAFDSTLAEGYCC